MTDELEVLFEAPERKPCTFSLSERLRDDTYMTAKGVSLATITGIGDLSYTRGRTEARVAVSDWSAAQTEEQQRTAFSKKHDIDLTAKDGKYEYSVMYKGERRLLLATDANRQGLEEAESKLTKLIQEKQKELARNFKVAFSQDGEDVEQQWIEKNDCTHERGSMIKARSPHMSELLGIEAALERSRPSHLSPDGKKGTKFYFLLDNYQKDDPSLAYYVGRDEEGRPSIFFEPGANDGRPITEKDARLQGKEERSSIMSLVIHELGHNAQENINFDRPRTEERYALMIGWVPFEDPKDHEKKWMLKGKDGRFYRYDKEHCKDGDVWFLSDSSGQPLDAQGKPTSSIKNAKTFSRSEIGELAAVKPLTYYFPSPSEMITEGLMMFRLDSHNRRELLEKSPQLYRAAKELDQQELNRYYGLDSTGKPKYVRSPEGYVIANNATTRRAIEIFESKVKQGKS